MRYRLSKPGVTGLRFARRCSPVRRQCEITCGLGREAVDAEAEVEDCVSAEYIEVVGQGEDIPERGRVRRTRVTG